MVGKKGKWKAIKDDFAFTILGNFFNSTWEGFKIYGTIFTPGISFDVFFFSKKSVI